MQRTTTPGGWTAFALLALPTAALAQGPTLEQVLSPAGSSQGDHFGTSVSASGDAVAGGAPNAGPFGGANHGRVVVHRRNGTVWTQEQSLVPADVAQNDSFGFAVALEGDTLAASSLGDDDRGSLSGSVYVYVHGAGGWTLQQKLTASDGAAGDGFGASLALDGGTLVVGASRGDATPGGNQGAVYVFERSAGVWTEAAKLTASDAEADDRFGRAVDIDGDTIVVGAHDEDSAGLSAGAAYTFQRSAGVWGPGQKLIDPAVDAFDFFGFDVAVSGDWIVVGANGRPDTHAGRAHVFSRSSGTWTPTQVLVPAGLGSPADFGTSVDARPGRIAVGAPERYPAPAVYTFRPTANGWTLESATEVPVVVTPHRYGSAVSLTAQRLFGGAPYDGSGFTIESGTVHVHAFDPFTGYCTARPNSTGAAARISAEGTDVAAQGDFTLRCEGLPPQTFAMFANGTERAFVPNAGGSQGDLCIGGALGRFAASIQGSGATGTVQLAVDLAAMPSSSALVPVMAGDTYRFQCWYRDQVGGPTSNFSDALEVTFR